jgi:hypothetical protein
MTDHFDVVVGELRTHARNIDAIRARFAAVKGASSHISQDDQAYGMLCGWISGILEEKHTRYDQVLAKVEKNLDLVVQSLQLSANDYQAVEDANAALMRATGEEGGL